MGDTSLASNHVLSFSAIVQKSNGVDLTFGSRRAGTMFVAVYRPGNIGFYMPRHGVVASVESSDAGATLQWRCPKEPVTATVELRRQAEGYVGKFSASGHGHAVVRLVWELPAGESKFPLVPAFMYGHNVGGRSPWAKYPQLDDSSHTDMAKPWITQEWFIRADRSSHCLTSMITAKNAYAIGGRDVCRYADGAIAEKNGLGISSSKLGRLSFSLGFANIPFTYSSAPGRNFISRPEGFVNLDRGEVASDFFLFAWPHNSRHEAAGSLLRKSYAVFHDEVTHKGSIDEAVTAIAETLVEFGYCQKARNYRSTFSINDHDETHDQFFASGWAGGSQVAYPLLLAGYMCKRADWIDNARGVLSNLAENGISSQTNLFYDNFDLTRNIWNTRGWWYDALEKPGHSGYVNGQACYYLLQGYLLEAEHGGEQDVWLDSAKRVLDHVTKFQAGRGGFGYTYSEEDGTPLDDVGFSGAWFVSALACLYRITKEKKYLEAACRAMDFYRTDVEAFCVYGGPHDIFKSPDDEGILAWIRASHMLHEITDNERFLEDLMMGLDYELSWKFAYNVVNEHEPLKSLNWCSVGGSVTSVNNSHVHPMSSAVLSSFRYAVERTGDEYLQSRLSDTIHWTLNTYMRHDGQFGWGKRGMISERYCHTDATLLERFADGRPASTWFCAHSWASGSVLEGLAGMLREQATFSQQNRRPVT